MAELKLEVFKLNKYGCRIEPADSILFGKAHIEATKYCLPYTFANKTGFYLYPPLDLDISYGNGKWQYNLLSEYPDEEVDLLTKAANLFGSKSITFEDSVAKLGKNNLSKVKFTAGKVEENTWQMWLGVIFRTPKDYGLLFTDPINIQNNYPWVVQKGIVMTDILRVDHWLNLKWTRQFEWGSVRINQKTPIAQIIPVHRSTYEKWELSETNELPEDVFKEWDNAYWNKWCKNDNTKDSTMFSRLYKEKTNLELKCPFSKH